MLLCAVISSAVGVSVAGAESGPSGEFLYPSPNQLPAPSVYNQTPACPVTETISTCEVPASLSPPPDPSNPEYYLNSAYWPAEKRPDIEMYAIQSYGYNYQNCSAFLPHYCFLVDAEAVGYPVSHTPEVGDLWLAPCEDLEWGGGSHTLHAKDCGSRGLSSEWFMGYVDQVFPDGSFIDSGGGGHEIGTDSGLTLSWRPGSMDPNTDFIGFMSSGEFPHLSGDACLYICPANTKRPELSTEAPHQYEVITVTSGDWSGAAPISYSYQWQLCNSEGSECSDIPGATSSSYTPNAADVGRTLAAVVGAANEAGSAMAPASSEVSEPVARPSHAHKPRNVARPTVRGVARSKHRLTASVGRWSGSTPIAYRYQWFSCTARGTKCKPMSRATRDTLLLPSAEIGRRVKVVVTAANGAGRQTVGSRTTAVIKK